MSLRHLKSVLTTAARSPRFTTIAAPPVVGFYLMVQPGEDGVPFSAPQYPKGGPPGEATPTFEEEPPAEETGVPPDAKEPPEKGLPDAEQPPIEVPHVDPRPGYK